MPTDNAAERGITSRLATIRKLGKLAQHCPLIASNSEGQLASDGKSASLLSDHVFHSSIAFEANPLQNFVIGHEVELERDSPRLGVGIGISHRDFDFHVAEVAAMKMLGYA
jgi:hypothetical protein